MKCFIHTVWFLENDTCSLSITEMLTWAGHVQTHTHAHLFDITFRFDMYGMVYVSPVSYYYPILGHITNNGSIVLSHYSHQNEFERSIC